MRKNASRFSLKTFFFVFGWNEVFIYTGTKSTVGVFEGILQTLNCKTGLIMLKYGLDAASGRRARKKKRREIKQH